MRCNLLVVLLTLAAALPVGAAADLTLEGRVVDPQDRPVAGAVITLIPQAAGPSRTATSDLGGRFAFDGLAVGAYRLETEAAGFQTHRADHHLKASVDDLTLRLALRAIEGSLLVTAALPELTTGVAIPGRALVASGTDDVAAFFRGVEGLGAKRRGAINLEPVVRGLQEEQIGIFVDGTRTFAAGPARMDSNLSHISPAMVQGVQVIKGPYALAWGSGALSAIKLETTRTPFAARGFDWQGTAGAGYGENGETSDFTGSVGGGSERLRFFVGAGRREGDDYEDGDGNEVPAGYESTDSRWRLGFKPAESTTIEASGGYQEQRDIDYPGRLLDATYFYTRSYATELSWTGDGTISNVFAQLYSNRKDHRMNNDAKPTAQPAPGRIPPFALRVDLPTESNTAGGRLRLGIGRGAVDWSFGTDYYRLEQNAARRIFRRDNDFLIFDDLVWPDAEIEDLGGYGQAVYHGDQLQVGATLRLDRVDATAGEASPFFLANTSGDLDQSETNVSAALSATFALGEAWRLYAGFGRAVRTATVLERYSDRFPSTKFQLAAEFMGNPALDPEASLELDLGLEGRIGSVVMRFDTFYRVIDDYITVMADPTLPKRLPLSPPVVYRYVNGSEATFWGGELRIDQRLHRTVAWHAAVSYTRGEDEAFNEPVLGVAPLTGSLGVRLQTPGQRLLVDLGARLVDRQDRVAASRFETETPGYSVFDLAASLRLGERLILTARVDNLTDKAYSDHLNAPNPFTRQRLGERGRALRAGVEVSF